VVGAERLAASVAVKLVAAGTQQLTAAGVSARTDFEEGVAAVFVVLDRQTLEEGVAGGAGSGDIMLFHNDIIP
jgi:hypothetical protein